MQLAIDLHTGEHVAIKFVERGDSFSHTSITRELFNQRLCSGHPHIVQILVRCAKLLPAFSSLYQHQCLSAFRIAEPASGCVPVLAPTVQRVINASPTVAASM